MRGYAIIGGYFMKLVRILILLVIIAGAAAGGYYLYMQYTASQVAAAAATQKSIQKVAVTRGTIAATVNTTGSIVPVTQVKVTFRTSGNLKEVNFKVGDVVKAGDVLARLDSTDLELSLATVLTNLDTAQIKYQQAANGPKADDILIAKANLDKSFTALQKAQGDYDRVAGSAGVGATSQSVALQQATLDYQIAQSNYNKAVAGSTEQDLALLQNTIKTNQIQVETAKRNLGFATLVSPIDGVVATVGANAGEQVGTNTVMFTLVNLNSLRVDASVDETDVAKLKVGQTASITLDALSTLRLQGKVTAIAPNATMQSGVVTYLIQITINDSDARLLAGLTATANIVTEQKDNAILVPNRAIKVNRNVRSVQVVDGNGLVEKQITTGMSNDLFTEVTAGLTEGEQVAIATTATNQPLSGGGLFSGGGGMTGGGAMFGR